METLERRSVMSDGGILVKPQQLEECAANLNNSAKTIQSCVDAVDSIIKSLTGNFEGISAEEIQARYAQARQRIESFRPLVAKFARELNSTATRFTKADHQLGNQGD